MASGPPPARLQTGERVEKLGAPNPVFREVIPEGKRASRAEMIRTANFYFSGLQNNDGKGYYPFTDDCDRYENGNHATNVPARNPVTGQTEVLSCKKAVRGGAEGSRITRARPALRRGGSRTRHRVRLHLLRSRQHQLDLQIAELFKVENGQIRRIEAVFHRCPFGLNSGWSTYEQGMSDQARDIR